MNDIILHYILNLILVLYGDSSLPRKIVQVVLDHLNDFICKAFIPTLQINITTILKRQNVPYSTITEIENCFNKYCNVLDNVKTEPKRFQILRTKGYIDPEEFMIGNTFGEDLVGNDLLIVPKKVYGTYVSLKKTMKLFLEIPGMFDQIMKYLQKLRQETHIITNIVQGGLWLEQYSKKFFNELVLPFYISYDDLEVGNALGSHAGMHKLGAVYASIACLPPHLASQLSSILFCMLVSSEDKKKCKNETVFRKLIDDINSLQEGIVINVNGVLRKVKFQLVLILGDNLGLNNIFGFVDP